MAKTRTKATTTETKSTSTSAKATSEEATPGKPPQKSRADLGRSPAELRGGSDSTISGTDPPPDEWYAMENDGSAPLSAEEKSVRATNADNEAYNRIYKDGGGRYAPPIRNK